MLMKILSPGGLIVIAIIVAIIFLPRRLPDAAKKMRRPMRAFPDEPAEPRDADGKPSDNAPKP